MYPVPWYISLFLSLPQAYLVIIVGFELFGLTINFKQTLRVAAIAALLSHLLHKLLVWYGLHTIVLTLTIIVICYIITRHNHWKIAAAIISGTAIIGIWESLYMPLFFWATHTTALDLQIKPWLHLFNFIPEMIVMVGTYALIKKYKFSFMNEKIGSC